MAETTITPTISRLAGGNGITLFEAATQEGFVVGGNTLAKFTGDVFIEDTELESLWNELPDNSSNNSTSGRINIKNLLKDILSKVLDMVTMEDVYPIGAVYISYESTSPAELFGGTWTAITGVFPYFNAGTATGGSNTHTLTVAQMPSHTHNINGGAKTGGSGTAIDSLTTFSTYRTLSGHALATGGSGSHNNMPAYQTFYAWRRTA